VADIKAAGGDFELFEGLDVGGNAPGERNAAGIEPDDDKLA
jgi:hypothetical protein